MWWHFVSGSASLPQIKEAVWPCSIILCLLLVSPPLFAGLWEASRRAVEPGWVYELPARLQHGTLPRVSARPSLPSRHVLASAPVPAAPTHWAHVLQHELPRPGPSGAVQVPQGAIRVTCHITSRSARGNMIVPQKKKRKEKKLHGKLCWTDVHPSPPRFCLFYRLKTRFHPTWWKCESPVYCALLAPHWGCL